jgi:hypothetical protein
MSNQDRRWKIAFAVVALVVAAQVMVSLAVRTERFHNYLSADLEKAFGRPVQVKHFNIEILPSPRIYATGVTVGEDPAFGYEYFLRAEHLTASLRWTGFLRGHFEFGTLSLGQPSLILVRNDQGRWNLENWLPPAKRTGGENSRNDRPTREPAIANRLQKIEFDDGRINFKSVGVKAPFALTGVSGSVEQVSPGRWKLQLQAQPWRSGVALQSTGVLEVQGDLAGTSARLQPASLEVHWDRVSLADLFRLLRGRDYGVRGTFTLQATAKSGAPGAGPLDTALSKDSFVGNDWTFSLKAFATEIHRWDLTEQPDNPKLSATMQGRWNVALKTINATKLLVESPTSNLTGTAQFRGAASPSMEVKINSAGIQAADVLAWYRAFHADVAEGISADEYFTGTAAVQGWPLKIQHMDFSTTGGGVRVAGMEESIKVAAFRAEVDRDKLVVNPVRVFLLRAASTIVPAEAAVKIPKHRPFDEIEGEINVALTHDFAVHAGAIGIQGRVDKAETILKVATAFGSTLNHGWDLTGPARADLRREWTAGARAAWSGSVDVNNAQMAAVGLNQPVELFQARLEWRNGRRVAQITQAEGFGAQWTGNVAEDSSSDPLRQGIWNVQLHADRLDATELDRWVGPRARPGWLRRLLPSLLGGAANNVLASELVRRLKVAGELQVDEFTIEKLKLQQVHLQGSLHDLQLEISHGRAQWAGGTLEGRVKADFVPRPLYLVEAALNGVDLAQLPIEESASQRVSGVASGTLRLKTSGVGRDELLQRLTGAGEVHLANLEFRGWDVNATVADGEAHAGVSRWTSGDGTFSVGNRSVVLEDVRLDGGAQITLVNGTVSFGRNANLAVETSAPRRAVRNNTVPGYVLKIVGPLEGPTLSREKSALRQPAD